MSSASTLGERLADWERERPTELALAWRDGEWTYRDLAQQSWQRAAALRAAGVGPGTRVGLLQPNRPEWLACAFGVWCIGGVLVPLNTLYRSAELEFALIHADVDVLIAEASFLNHDYRAMLHEIIPRLPGRDGAGQGAPRPLAVWYSGGEDLPADKDWTRVVAAARTTGSAFEGNPAADAGIFFTSGSTAAPKAAVHTHASMLRAADNVGERLGLDSTDRTYGYLPLFFNGGLVGVALATLSRGGAVLLQDVFSAAEAIVLMKRYRCSVFFGWPHQAEAIASHPTFDKADIALRKGPGANAPWADALLASDHRCVGTWGMTETGPMAACSHHSDPLTVRRGSHGRAMPGLEIRIVDEENSPVPAGIGGEIAVRGTSMMRTYYGRAPAECFDAEGFFHTGDGGYLDTAGSLTFTGRIADIIKTAGVNVASAEVEAVLSAHRDVESAYVVPVPHPTRGENVAAFVVGRPLCELTTDALLEHCRAELASYKVPRHLFIVDAGELPLLGSGKIDRRALRQRAAALAGTERQPPAAESSELPQ